jgi:hypothetical protein
MQSLFQSSSHQRKPIAELTPELDELKAALASFIARRLERCPEIQLRDEQFQKHLSDLEGYLKATQSASVDFSQLLALVEGKLICQSRDQQQEIKQQDHKTCRCCAQVIIPIPYPLDCQCQCLVCIIDLINQTQEESLDCGYCAGAIELPKGLPKGIRTKCSECSRDVNRFKEITDRKRNICKTCMPSLSTGKSLVLG